VTDSPGTPDPDESPEIEDVRRLLADARHTEPMPDDVVARMDDVIAGLRETPAVDEPETRVAPDRYANVMPLAPRRRLRAAGMLVAAAAVVVGGVVVAQNLPQSTSSSASTAEAGSSAQDSAQPPAQSSPHAQDFSNESRATGSRVPELRKGRLVVHPRRFSVDALAGRKLLLRNTPDALTLLDAQCASVPNDDGTVLSATYQRAPAALVYRPASGGSQVVDLYVCGSPQPVRTATLPAP